MPAYELLRRSNFDPSQIEKLATALEEVLRELHTDRADPAALYLARRLVEIAQAGERDPGRLRQSLLDAARRTLVGRHADEIALYLASVVESSDDAIISMDLRGTITTWNNAAEEIFGYTSEEAVGKSIQIIVPPDRQNEETMILERIRDGRRIKHYETVRQHKNGNMLDISLTVSPIKNGEGQIIGASKIARDVSERKRKDLELAALAREAEHRAKNILSVVQATVQLSRAESVDELKNAIEGRLRALANVNSLFAGSRWTEVELEELFTQELAPFCGGGSVRCHFHGPRIGVDAKTGQAIAMVIHELATNATKYGGLSAPGGRLEVEWSQIDETRIAIQWAETGGPRVQPPARQGFGTGLMTAMVGSLKGSINFDWRPAGLVCEIRVEMQDGPVLNKPKQ